MTNCLFAYVGNNVIKAVHRNINPGDVVKGIQCYHYDMKGPASNAFIPLFTNMVRKDGMPNDPANLAVRMQDALCDLKQVSGKQHKYPLFVPGKFVSIPGDGYDIIAVEAHPGFHETKYLKIMNTALHRIFSEMQGTPEEDFNPCMYLECVKPGLGKEYAESLEGIKWYCFSLTQFYMKVAGYHRPVVFDTVSGRIRGPWADVDEDDDDDWEA